MEKLPTILLPSAQPQPIQPLGTHHKAPKGRSETQFERDLWRYFPGKIQVGLLIKRPDLAQPYVPDFAYVDRTHQLYLDIEVDEPYTYDTQQPLHYLGCPKDQRRNQFFLDQGWGVIRFSEAQVLRFPASCCKTIAATIATLTQDNSIMTPFRQIPTLKPESRWSADEAQRLAAQGYRDSYLASSAEVAEPKKKRRKNKVQPGLMSTNLAFHCPACGEMVWWQGHYVQCSNCGYDRFVL